MGKTVTPTAKDPASESSWKKLQTSFFGVATVIVSYLCSLLRQISGEWMCSEWPCIVINTSVSRNEKLSSNTGHESLCIIYSAESLHTWLKFLWAHHLFCKELYKKILKKKSVKTSVNLNLSTGNDFCEYGFTCQDVWQGINTESRELLKHSNR